MTAALAHAEVEGADTTWVDLCAYPGERSLCCLRWERFAGLRQWGSSFTLTVRN